MAGVFDFFLWHINYFLETTVLPLPLLPIGILAGAIFLIAGSRIFKVVVIILMFIGGGIFAYKVSSGNVLIAIAAAVGAGLIAYPLHFLFGVLLTGLAFGGVVSQVLYYLTGFPMSVVGFAVGMLLGIALGVIFFKPAIIFTTSMISAAVITLSVLLLIKEKSLVGCITLSEVQLDLIQTTLLCGSLFAAGVGTQTILLAIRKKKPKKKPAAEE